MDNRKQLKKKEREGNEYNLCLHRMNCAWKCYCSFDSNNNATEMISFCI